MNPNINYALPKYYANVNKNLPADYWDYENFELSEWGYIASIYLNRKYR